MEDHPDENYRVRLFVRSESTSTEQLERLIGTPSSPLATYPGPSSVGIWTLDSRLGQQASLNDHLLDVVEQLDLSPSILQRLPSDAEVQVRWGNRCRTANCEARISARTLGRIGAVGLTLAIDIYFVGDA